MSETAVADLVHHGEAERWGGWSYRKPDRGEHFRRCSYCGSISPEDLAAEPAGTGCAFPGCPSPRSELADIHFPVERIPGRGASDGFHLFADTGWRASWADRKYGWPHKFYVEGIANRTPDALFVVSSAGREWEPPPGPAGNLEYVARDALTPEQRQAAERDGYDGKGGEGRWNPWWLAFGHHATHHAKFYTAHLADPELSPEAKATIERVCGLRFTFDGSRVGWQAA